MEYSTSYFKDDFAEDYKRILLDGNYKMYYNYHISHGDEKLNNLNAVPPFVVGNILYKMQDGVWPIIITAIRLTYRKPPQDVRVNEDNTFVYKNKIIAIREQSIEPYDCVSYSNDTQDDVEYGERTPIGRLSKNCIVITNPCHDDSRGDTYAITITDIETGILEAFILYN